MIELLWCPRKYQLGAEELLELGRPIRMHRYPHTPFLAGRLESPRADISANLLQPTVNLLRPAENLLRPAMGQAASPGQSSTLTKAFVIGIPILIVVGIFAFTK